MRAVADDHQAALSVGISLRTIWVIVWAIAGFVALVAGIMWGAKSGVQFSLSLIALKALPVLMLGGFTSIPGAIIGGLIIGVGEKMFEFLIGAPLLGGATENWFAYMVALVFLVFRPQGLFGEKNHRKGVARVLPRSRRIQNLISFRPANLSNCAGQDRVYRISDIRIYYVIPLTMSEYWAQAVFLPFLIFGIAAIGLNILTGYCGQVSLGSGGFMAVGAYSCYKLMTAFPDMNIVICILLSGGVTAFVGLLFGLPSLRIKGFYLAVATLAAQFFLVWMFNKVGWFYNYSASGQITAPEREIFGFIVTGAKAETLPVYYVCLVLLVILAVVARNLTRGAFGRKWMAIRDMDIAAEIIGVNPLMAKLTAFAISSFYVGISGALLFALYLGAVEVGEAFSIQKSFLILFMIIIGGLGSIFGSLIGAAFMIGMPVLLKNLLVSNLGWPGDIAKSGIYDCRSDDCNLPYSGTAWASHAVADY